MVRSDLPLLTLDLDGVICEPILRQDVGINRTFLDPDAAPEPARVYPAWLRTPLDHVRFDLRRPVPRAREALQALRGVRRLVILTGRRTAPAGWLRRHRLDDLVDEVIINRTALRSAHFKLEAIRALGGGQVEHVEDDPRTAQLLAEAAGVRVYLCDWPRNRDLAYDPHVVRVQDLDDLARRLAAASRA